MAGSNWERVYKMTFASVYPHYVAKAEKKGRTKAEVDEIIRWLTGYSHAKGWRPRSRSGPTSRPSSPRLPGSIPRARRSRAWSAASASRRSRSR